MGGKRLYSKKNYMVLKVSGGYIVYNTKKRFEEGHTHISNLNMVKTVIDLSINKKLPKTKSTYIVESLVRLTRDMKYKQELERYLETLINK